MHARGLRSLFFIVAFVSCADAVEKRIPASNSPIPEPVVAPIVTDNIRYRAQPGPFGPETRIVSTFTAPSDRPVYIVNCNGAFTTGLQRREGDRWIDAWAASINGCMSSPIVIAPGGRLTATLMVRRGSGGAPHGGSAAEGRLEAGTYRVVWFGVFTSFDPKARDMGEELPLEQRVSAPLVIE